MIYATTPRHTESLPFFIYCLITFEKTISFDTFEDLIKLRSLPRSISKLLRDNSENICPEYDLNEKTTQFNTASSHQQISIQSQPKAKPLSFLRLIKNGQIDEAAKMVDLASHIDLEQALLYDQTYGNDKMLLKLLSTCYDQNVQIRAIKKLAQFGKVGIFKRIIENRFFNSSTLKEVFLESIKKQDLLIFDFFYRNLKTDSWISDFFHKSCYETTLDNLANLIFILKDRNHNKIKLSNHHVIDHILDRSSHYPEDTQLINFILEYFEF